MKSNRNNEREKFDMGFDDLGFDDPMDTMDTDLGFDDVDDNDKIDDFSISSDAGDYFFFFFFFFGEFCYVLLYVFFAMTDFLS